MESVRRMSGKIRCLPCKRTYTWPLIILERDAGQISGKLSYYKRNQEIFKISEFLWKCTLADYETLPVESVTFH